jgi:hypothetical protein
MRAIRARYDPYVQVGVRGGCRRGAALLPRAQPAASLLLSPPPPPSRFSRIPCQLSPGCGALTRVVHPPPGPPQARGRVDQLRKLGHVVDKVEYILMGGTFMSLPADYRDFFVRNLHDALSGHASGCVSEVRAEGGGRRSGCLRRGGSTPNLPRPTRATRGPE